MSYQTKQPRTIYVLPPRKILSSTPIAPTNGQFHAKPTTTYRLIRPNYTLPPVAPQQPKLVPKVEQKPILKRPNDDVISALLGESMEPSGPRKRERLTHLTAEEKMDRRKMKNRMAAQTARDKKKERSQKMEDVMKSIVDENRKLRTENLRLRQEIEEMRRSQNLRMYSVGNVENRSISKLDESLESAAFINAPLLRVQARRLEKDNINQNNRNKKSIMSHIKLTIQLVLFILHSVSKNKSLDSEEETTLTSEMNLKLKKSLKILRVLTSTSTDCAMICRRIMKKTLPHHHRRHLTNLLHLKTVKSRNNLRIP